MKDKKVKKIFNNISLRYDLANFFISFGIERYWRVKFLKMISGSEKRILDACCGTGYSTIAVAGRLKNEAALYGIDFSSEMLEIARLKSKKFLSNTNKHPGVRIRFQENDVTYLDFNNNYFDLITIVFGIRNVEYREKAIKEFYRMSSEKGKLLIMEFNYPKNKFIRKFYDFYLNYVISNIGAMITGNKKAYSYLAQSIKNFPDPDKFSRTIKESGWKILKVCPMTFGICTIYYAEK
ncbi:MAG: bifunctional demethylmenaquinone methyltransferase/2-methoxy-6-polyprenyl-1,4-benzoquinol methylase UbiE [Actinomycetota bacterium]|nr:bifunctional demethylmenaquinone methyltransferase/2-methoxy-6-polyprenyl-1,4-benzoquinol methylase UbiE [Actinomycetota bacterium]